MKLSEDETTCVALATLDHRIDEIDGFCGKKISNYKCSYTDVVLAIDLFIFRMFSTS